MAAHQHNIVPFRPRDPLEAAVMAALRALDEQGRERLAAIAAVLAAPVCSERGH